MDIVFYCLDKDCEYAAEMENREEDSYTSVYHIECPVDVKVYASNGRLEASVVNHRPYYDMGSPLAIAAIDDSVLTALPNFLRNFMNISVFCHIQDTFSHYTKYIN